MDKYDFAIIGAGAAGLHLAIKMAEETYFQKKQIIIIEREPKDQNDKTWSFWEKGSSRWDSIASKQWSKALFYSSDKKVEIKLDPYSYKTIRSSNFYRYARELLSTHPNFHWVEDHVTATSKHTISGQKQNYSAQHIFDSRIPGEFFGIDNRYTSLTQHFWGWFIETKEDVFDDEAMTMMDYRLKWKDQTSFTYVLPFNPKFALVEFTLFNNELLTQEEYETKLKVYIETYLGIGEYSIKEIEVGSIPMTTYPFHQHHEETITKIGTAGGWVRPSSGYSFKNADRYSQMIIENLKRGKRPWHGVATGRFRYYDTIFIKVLKEHNDLGEEIFYKLYNKQPIHSLFRFLDEQSNFLEDSRIMLSMNNKEFRDALLRN